MAAIVSGVKLLISMVGMEGDEVDWGVWAGLAAAAAALGCGLGGMGHSEGVVVGAVEAVICCSFC